MPGLFCIPLAKEEHASCNQFFCVKALTLLCSAKRSGAAALIIWDPEDAICETLLLYMVFYFSKLDSKSCFLITVSRFAFPRFVLEKGHSCIFVTYGNAL